jgi:predicted MFS family arabinose efflux permease
LERNNGKRRNLLSVAILSLANIAISINQGSTAAIYLQISQNFAQGVIGLGLLTSSFFLAYAMFEFPGGFLAARLGQKRIVLSGMTINAVSVIASSFSPGFGYLVLFRFFAGMGSALAWPSILVMIVRSFKSGSGGVGVGLMSVSSAAGSLIGLSVWPVFSEIAGWRFSVLTGGIIAIVMLGPLISLVPLDEVASGFRLSASNLRRIVFDKTLAAMAMANFGLAATSGIVTNFMIYYMESNFRTSPSFAGPIVGVGSAIPIITSLLIGRLYDRTRKLKRLLFAASGATSLSVSFSALASLPAAIVTSITARPVSVAGGTIVLSAARELGSVNPEYESATVGWVDSFSLYGIFAAPIYFPLLAVNFGYSVAWLVSGLGGILFALPLLAVKDIRGTRAKSRS